MATAHNRPAGRTANRSCVNATSLGPKHERRPACAGSNGDLRPCIYFAAPGSAYCDRHGGTTAPPALKAA